MRKELRPVHDLVECDVCGRTILKGERIEAFVAGGDRRKVCELCSFHALRLGWLRESELDQRAPERTHTRPRRPLWARLTQWAEDQGLLGEPRGGGARDGHHPARAERAEERADGRVERPLEPGFPDEVDAPLGAPVARPPERPATGASFRDMLAGRRDEPHEVHAVPTSREGKLERAFELFNASEHRRTITGIARALGEPWVSASPIGEAAAAREVSVVVAWELSWYHYRVDLGDADQPVHLLDRGDEIDDLDETQRGWNAATDGDGRLALAAEPVS